MGMNRLYTVKISPLGAVRMTRRGKFTNEAAHRYLAYKGFLTWELKKQHKGGLLSGPLEVNLTFIMPIPKSWSGAKKARMIGEPHTKKSDIDNIIKGVFDGANKVIWTDDNLVYKVTAAKYYGIDPQIMMEVIENVTT